MRAALITFTVLALFLAAACQQGSEMSKNEYVQKMQAQLEELDQNIQNLKEQAANATGQAEKDLDRAAESLEMQRQQASQNLEEIKKTSAEQWEAMKTSLQDTMDQINKAYQQALEKYTGHEPSS